MAREPRHGTLTEYRYGCRCDECRGALRTYKQARRAAKAGDKSDRVVTDTNGDTEPRPLGAVCAVGGRDDGTLRVCCSSHNRLLCAHHYARSHFVETMPSYAAEWACDV